MVQVICPVCGAKLNTEGGSWRCEAGHSFDVARQGYVNLLPVSQKHSKRPGDTREQVAARKAFLDSGVYGPIAETLAALTAAAEPAAMLDVGCGEGYYLTKVQEHLPALEGWGIDISKDAVRYAAVRNKQAKFLTATASHLPFADGQFDVLSSMFALTLPEEFSRVLKPEGRLIQVTAGADHLMGLKSVIYPEIHRKEKTAEAELPGFVLEAERLLEFDFPLEGSEAVMQLLAMTPHFLRITKEGLQRAQETERLSDRAQVCFRVYRKAESVV